MSAADIPVAEMVAFAATRKPQPLPPAARKSLWPGGYNLTRWNTHQGSQNKAPVAHTAIGDWRWLVELARHWRSDGLWGMEFGAPGFYFTGPVACLIVALREARAARDDAAVSDLEAALRAVWAWECLTAVPWPRTASLMIFGRPGAPLTFRGPGEVAYGYHGPTCAVAGDRWNLRSAEGYSKGGRTFAPAPGGYPDRDPHGGWLAWALDVPRRDSSGASSALRRPRKPDQYGPHNAVGHVLGVDDFEAPVPPEPFGLTARDRDHLRRMLQSGGTDREALEAAVAMVAAAPPRQGHRRTIRRTDRGVEHVCWVARSGNKTTLAIAMVDESGLWTGVRPCFHKGTGANGGYFVEDAGAAGLRMGCGEGERASIERLGGREVYRVEVVDGRVELFRGGGSTAAPTPAPAPPAGAASALAAGGAAAAALGRRAWLDDPGPADLRIDEPRPKRPLAFVADQRGAIPGLLELSDPRTKKPATFTLVSPAPGRALVVRGVGDKTRRHLLKAIRPDGAPTTLVVESKGDDQPLYFIREG